MNISTYVSATLLVLIAISVLVTACKLTGQYKNRSEEATLEIHVGEDHHASGTNLSEPNVPQTEKPAAPVTDP